MGDARVGFALTGSFCTLEKAIRAMEETAREYPKDVYKRQEHGQLPPPQLNIGGNGVEHIGCGDQEEEQNKDIGCLLYTSRCV